MPYEELVKRLRYCAISDNQCLECKYHGGSPDGSKMCLDVLMEDAADAIEELSRQRDRAYARLCEWCGVCSEGKRNAEDCEIAALNPEPPKEKA